MEPNDKEIENEEIGGKEPEVVQSEETKEEVVVDDRPEKNWKAELDRKNRELERVRQENEMLKTTSSQRRDQNDMSTWGDHELKAVLNSNDPNTLPYKDQINDILLERKIKSVREKERMQEKRAISEMELRTKYPEALDPSSDFALKMEQTMYDLDLQKTPAGRLAAARIVAAETKGKVNKSTELDRNAEKQRVRDVKSQMVDGDRPKSTEPEDSPKKIEDLQKRLLAGDKNAMTDVMKQRGTLDRFRKVWGQ